MNCVPLESATQLRNGLALLRVGQNVELSLLRNGTERSVNLTHHSSDFGQSAVIRQNRPGRWCGAGLSNSPCCLPGVRIAIDRLARPAGVSRTKNMVVRPEEIRTPGLLIRNQALYPAELRAQRKNVGNLARG